MIPYGRQEISDADIAAVVAVLRSDFLTQGPVVPRFEAAVAARSGAAHGVAFCNATAALHGACAALGLGPGDLLWTVPNSFVASANCGRYLGAEVDFVDIDLDTGCLSVPALAAKLDRAARNGRLPKVLVPVDFAGQPCDLAEIAQLARSYGVRILEDAAHAIGATYQGRPVGGGWSDITVFSFHPVKIVTTGEGGMAVTDDPELAARMGRFRGHGIERDPVRLRVAPDGAWYYEQQELGFNYRMTDLQAALGLSQLDRLDSFLARRAELAARYDRLLAGLPLRLPQVKPDRTSAWHLYVVRVDEAASPLGRAALFAALRERGIGVQVHYIPIHTHPDYRHLGFDWDDFPAAEAHYLAALSLPLYPGLSDALQDLVAGHLHALLGEPSRRAIAG